MPPVPLPVSPPPPSPSTHSLPPSMCHNPQISQLSSHCCAFPISWCFTSSSAPERETTLGSAPATETRSPQALKTLIHPSHPQKGAILTTSLTIPLDMQAAIHVEHGPSKKSYASIAALDLTEDTSLPLNPHLHHLLLTEPGIPDIQACKTALSDPDTLTYDQGLLDPDI